MTPTTYAVAVKYLDKVDGRQSAFVVSKQPDIVFYLMYFMEEPINFTFESFLNVFVLDDNYIMHCFDQRWPLRDRLQILTKPIEDVVMPTQLLMTAGYMFEVFCNNNSLEEEFIWTVLKEETKVPIPNSKIF